MKHIANGYFALLLLVASVNADASTTPETPTNATVKPEIPTKATQNSEHPTNSTETSNKAGNSTTEVKADDDRSKRAIYQIPTMFGSAAYMPLFGNRGLLITSNVGGLFRRRPVLGYGYNNYYGNNYGYNNYYGGYYDNSVRVPVASGQFTRYFNLGRPAGQCQVIRYLGYQIGYPSYYCWCSNIGYFTHHMRTNNYAPCANNLPTNGIGANYQWTQYARYSYGYGK
ncbi:unnamed protein product, partial [Mesorhabditis spiculigera]